MPEISTPDDLNKVLKFPCFHTPLIHNHLSFEFNYQASTQVLKPHNSKPQDWISHQTSEINNVAFYMSGSHPKLPLY